MTDITWDKTQRPTEIVRSIGDHAIYFDHEMVIDFIYPSAGRGSDHHVNRGGYACTCGEGGWYDYDIALQSAFEHLLDVADELLQQGDELEGTGYVGDRSDIRDVIARLLRTGSGEYLLPADAPPEWAELVRATDPDAVIRKEAAPPPNPEMPALVEIGVIFPPWAAPKKRPTRRHRLRRWLNDLPRPYFKLCRPSDRWDRWDD